MIRFGDLSFEGEEIVYSNPTCILKINHGNDRRGELILTRNDICWKSSEPGSSFTIPWSKIIMQAITSKPTRCIYFMIDVKWPEQTEPTNGNHANEDEDDEQDDDADDGVDCEKEQDLTEFHLIPDQLDDVSEIYYVMGKFPEPGELNYKYMSDEEGNDEFFDGDDMERMNLDDDGRFADAQ